MIRLSVFGRCAAVMLAYMILIEPFGLDSLAEGATLYEELATKDWGCGGQDIEYECDDNGACIEKKTEDEG